MAADEREQKMAAYRLGVALARVLSPATRYDLTDWSVAFDALPLATALIELRTALEAATGGVPDWFDPKVGEIGSQWNSAAEQDGGTVKLALWATWQTYCGLVGGDYPRVQRQLDFLSGDN